MTQLFDTTGKHRSPTAYLLPQGERRCILEMGAADLDQRSLLRCLAAQGSLQGLDSGQQPVLQGKDRGHVHGRGKDVV